MTDELNPVEPVQVADDVAEPIVDDVTPMEPSTDYPEPEADSPQPEAALSEAMIGRAGAYGLSAEHLTGLDDSQVERLFGAMDRRTMRPEAGPVNAGYGQQVPRAVSPQSVAAMTEQYEALNVEYGDDLDESVRAPFKSVVDHMNGQLKQIHEFRHEMLQELQAMNVLREFAGFDQFIGGLGDEWNGPYGTGSTLDLDPQGAEFQKRLEVFHGARSLMADAQRRGQRMAVKDAQKRSHHAVHYDRIAGQNTEQLNGKIARRRKGFSEKPVKGKTAAMSPHEEAVAAWTK